MENTSHSELQSDNARAVAFTPRSKRALLIGINTYISPLFNNLAGCVNDVWLMFKLLTETFQFPPENVAVLTDDSAETPTRDGILRALSRLVSETGDDDLVVVFYAGHGSRRRNSAKADGYNETIVPRDSGRTRGHNAGEQFTINRDITDDELNELMLRPLTSKTSNLVLIFDSCHSGHILREVDLPSAMARFVEADECDAFTNESLDAPSEQVFSARSVSRTVKGASGWLLPNDQYVLLAACQAHEKANEKHVTFIDALNTEVLIHGAWTYELCRAILADTQTENSTYRSVFERAFPLVTEAFPAQHPTMEGVLNRAVFGVHTVLTMPYAVVVAKRGKQVQLSCGAAHGFSLGSQFVLCSKGIKIRPSNDDAAVIGMIAISEVGAVTSWACSIESDADLDQVDIGSPVFESAHAFDELKIGVRVVISQSLRQWVAANEQSTLELDNLNTYCLEIAAFVKGSSVLFLVEAEDKRHDCITIQLSLLHGASQRTVPDYKCKPYFFVYGADGQLEIEKPLAVDSFGICDLKNKLELLGKYHRVLRLNNSYQKNNPIQDRVEMHLTRRITEDSAWMDVLDEPKSLFPTFYEDQFVGAKIINKSFLSVEIALIELAEDGSVCVLHPPNGTTETIEPGSSLFVGSEWGALEVASSLRSQEILKLFVTTEKTDFAILEQDHFRGNFASSLEELLGTNAMRLVGKRAKKDSFWTTVQRSFKISKKMQRSIVAEIYHSNGSPNGEHTSLRETCQDSQFINFSADNEIALANMSQCTSSKTIALLLTALFNSFEVGHTEKASNSCVNHFYEQVNLHTMNNSSTNAENTTLFKDFIGRLLSEPDNIPPVYQMVRAIWFDDDSANKNGCQELQNQLSFIGFSELVRYMDPSHYSTEYAKAHYNIGLILSQNSYDLLSAKEAIKHYELALEVWKKEVYAVDYGQTLLAIADVHSNLFEQTETMIEKLQHAKQAITLYKSAYAVLQAASSTVVINVIYNLTSVLSRLAVSDLGDEFTEETNFALLLIENTISSLRSQPLTNDTAEMLVDIINAEYELLKRDIALPWQENIINICDEILRSQCIDNQCRINCNKLMGDAFRSRLVGSRDENLQRAAEHLLVAAELDLCQLDRDYSNDRFAECVINLGATVDELRHISISPEIDVCVEKSKKLLEWVVGGSLALTNDELKAAALYNLSSFVDGNFEQLQHILPMAADYAPRVCAHIKADLALELLSKSFPKVDGSLFEKVTNNAAESSTFDTIGICCLQPAKGFDTTRFEELECHGGTACGHTDNVLRYLQEAEELLLVDRNLDMGYIKNLGTMGRYWATHCKLSLSEKMNRAWDSYLKAIEEVERLWPLYNVDAQVTLMNEIGQLWEDALDVAITRYFSQTEQHARTICQHIFYILCSAKSRNLLAALRTLSSSALHISQVMQACTTPSSTSLSAVKTLAVVSTWRSSVGTFSVLQSDVVQNLQEDEVVVEWWMSNKHFAFCIVYSKTGNFHICRMWNRAEIAQLYKLCLEAQGNRNFHSWTQKFIHRLSKALCLEELYKFLTGNFPTATKLFLVPHAYLHCCPIHTLPIFEDKLFCLLDVFPGGVSFLPNCNILEYLRQSHVNNTQSKLHAFLFQADPKHDLPYSRQEVCNIEDVVKATQITCNISMNTTAETFTSIMPSMADDQRHSDDRFAAPFLLHVACHGEYIDDKPEDSYLLFEDGKFTMTQFRSISLASCQLAVLSACKSGLRDFSRTHVTDIFIGFGAQFIAKGCKNVLLALSPVADQSTAELMRHFYEGFFNEKKSVASSLRNAQMKLRDRASSLPSEKRDNGVERLVGKKTSTIGARAGSRWSYAPFVLLGAGEYKLSSEN
ncbi:uncharacterized protein LOC124813201 [Hydra vulgaris]|uniref:uncharacterized protein LOC124813201 n=1 Tax=Hydra vulgaris TaxID=6087 RepID=UPI001F5E7BA1|nr:uncharacterized protein LOC124813201 [Hydra vulgaris]XP_047135899.1 uncharacterized protein LOC124813201 [Hydra vulgaris]XP_047135900.1 uncharacterized protein LOC124813201 [Hydra vulgaris]